MQYVRFLVTRTVQRKGGPTYEEGRVYLMKDSSAKHWRNRGAAEFINPPAEIPAEVVPDPDDQELQGDLSESDKSVESDKAAGADDVNPVDSPSNVEGPNGGSAGLRTEHEPVGSESGPRRGRSGARRK